VTKALRLVHVIAVAGCFGVPARAGSEALLAATVDLHRLDHTPHETALQVRAYTDGDQSVRVQLSMAGAFPRGTHVTRLPRIASVTIPAMRMPAPRVALPVQRAGLRRILIGQLSPGRELVRVELDLVRGARAQLSYDEGQAEIRMTVRSTPRTSANTSKRVALTFDDTPFPQTTPKLLEMLEHCDVAATFFVIGQKVERYPDLILQLFDAGHSIQNHSYSHTCMPDLSAARAVRELEMCDAAVESITGVAPKYFRPPGGRSNGALDELVRQAGLTMALWDVNPNDCNVTDPDRIARTVLRNARHGDVIMLHDGAPGTMHALPGIIAALRSRGYSFVTLDEMLR